VLGVGLGVGAHPAILRAGSDSAPRSAIVRGTVTESAPIP